MARWLMIIGTLLLATGVLMHFAPWTLNWFGKLPGDIRIETAQGKSIYPHHLYADNKCCTDTADQSF